MGGISGYLPNGDARDGLLTSLAYPQTRNFYFSGHGSSKWLQDGLDEPTHPNCFNLSDQGVGTWLANGAYSIQQRGWTRGHPYRFVFLDACRTADDLYWSRAFGIAEDISFLDLGKDPSKVQAFVGWKGEPRAPNSNAGWDDYGQMLVFFFYEWMSEQSLDTCISRAQKHDPFGDGSLILPWRLGQPWFLGGGPFRGNFYIQVYGYRWITRSGFD